ncbi:glycoside hydrolase family 16 protein [Xylariomycetidae sp. FL2044]|nr:glycoside hydrolase family 16 protein [Xylariomycetidae sp. FL2044]
MSFKDQFNRLKNKAEEINRKHNILPFGQQGHQQQQHQQQAYPNQQYYPGQQQPPQGQWQPHPPQGQWQQSPQPQWQQQQQPQGQQWQQPPQPNQYNRPPMPPPVPSHSRPSAPNASASPQPNAHPSPVYWRCEFNPSIPVSQEFEQKQGHGEPYGWGNNELENYTSSPQNSFYTPDGKLIVRALAQQHHPDPELRYTSARLVTHRSLSRPKGCLTAWLTLPSADGIWPAFWMLPREPFLWPHDGEVDIAESWNGEHDNHSCLHWGFYTPEDAGKHLSRKTRIPDMAHRPVRFDFAWSCEGTGLRGDGKSAGGGRLMWLIDGRPVMKNLQPPGTRPIEDWCVLLNVAMGGTVCQGRAPRDGSYDLVVHSLQMSEEPEGGWWKFDADWYVCPDGAVL